MQRRLDPECQRRQLIELVELQVAKIDAEMLRLSVTICERKRRLDALRARIRRNDYPLLHIERNKHLLFGLEKKLAVDLEGLWSLLNEKRSRRAAELARAEILRRVVKR